MPVVDGKIRCGKCREFKVVGRYTPTDQKRGSGRCADCRYAHKKAKYQENPEKGREEMRQRRLRNPEAYKAMQAKWRKANAGLVKGYNLKKNYGVSQAQYDEMLLAQDGGCAICGAETNKNGKALFVDHCHDSGAVRGILCYKCNTGLGSFGDSPALIEKALSYLRQGLTNG